MTLVRTTPTTPPRADREDPLESAIGRLGELWDKEYLPEIRRHLRFWESLDPSRSTLPEHVSQLDDSLERTRRLYEIHFFIWFPFMAAISLFDDFHQDVFGSTSAFDPYRLLQGFENKTVASGRALWQLSRRALELSPVRAVLEKTAAEHTLAALEAFSEGQVFLRLLRDYLETWGQRGERWGWSFPSWIEVPTSVIKTLKEYVRQPDRDLEAEMMAQIEAREQLVGETRARLPNQPPELAERFEFLVAAAQKAIVLTEDHSHWIDFRCMYHLHRISLEVGRWLAAAGVIDAPEDVFLLSPSEVTDTALKVPRLNRRAQVAARRAEIEYFRSVPVPATLGTSPTDDAPNDPVNAALGKFFGASAPTGLDRALIRGNSGSPGRAGGPAWHIRGRWLLGHGGRRSATCPLCANIG
jgi:hypothetical protein